VNAERGSETQEEKGKCRTWQDNNFQNENRRKYVCAATQTKMKISREEINAGENRNTQRRGENVRDL